VTLIDDNSQLDSHATGHSMKCFLSLDVYRVTKVITLR